MGESRWVVCGQPGKRDGELEHLRSCCACQRFTVNIQAQSFNINCSPIYSSQPPDLSNLCRL